MSKLWACGKCRSMEKIEGMHVFGYLTLECRDCGFKIQSEHRSGDYEHLLRIEMIDRWNNGIEDKKDE